MRSLVSIFNTIQEKQRFGKETGTNYDPASQRFKPLYDQHMQERNLFVQYSNVNKLGVNVGGSSAEIEYANPTGIYCYPTYGYSYEQLITGKVPFAGERKYIIGFEAKDKKRLLVIDKSGDISSHSGYTKADAELLLRSNTNIANEFKTLGSTAFGTKFLTAVQLASVISHPTRGTPKFNRSVIKAVALQKTLGIQGIVDEGAGAISGYEPCQAVFFRSSFVKLLFVIENKIRSQPTGKI